MVTKDYLGKELTEKVRLCSQSGVLNEEGIGWSRLPLHTCNIVKPQFRCKKWDYWSVFNEGYYFTIAIMDMGYIRSIFFYLLDKSQRRLHEVSINTLAQSSCSLSEEVCGDAAFKAKGVEASVKRYGESIIINASCKDFKGEPMSAELEISIPRSQESLNVVIPWSYSKYHFTSKQNCLPAKGSIRIGNKEYIFDKQDTLGSLDYGRGIWPYNSFWNWASCSGYSNGKRLGFNLGGGWTYGTGANENAVFVDNKMHKLDEDVEFIYDTAKKLEKWSIKTKDTEDLRIVFTPIHHRLASTNYLIIKSDLHQVFGSFTGNFKTKTGEQIEFNNIFGCVEEHTAKW